MTTRWRCLSGCVLFSRPSRGDILAERARGPARVRAISGYSDTDVRLVGISVLIRLFYTILCIHFSSLESVLASLSTSNFDHYVPGEPAQFGLYMDAFMAGSA